MSGKVSSASRWNLAGLVIALAAGAVCAWVAREAMNPDGVSYLDLADAWRRGHWAVALNSYWSPLYPWLLAAAVAVFRPAPDWEFPLAHAVNVACYGAAAFTFHRLVAAFRLGKPTGPWVERAWVALAWAIFLWSSVLLISLDTVSPDLLVAASVWGAAALLLGIREEPERLARYGWLGAVLGAGYLAKAVMFPVGLLGVAAAALAAGGVRRSTRGLAAVMAAFGAVSLPWAAGLSAAKARPTWGDTGSLNYAWYVNGVRRWVGWEGGPPESGAPLHPPRRLFHDPAVLAFDGHPEGTYPGWLDPPWWHEGLRVRLEPGRQWAALRLGLADLWRQAVPGALMIGLAAAWLLATAGAGQSASAWLLPWPAAALLLYALVHVEPRLIAPFAALAWLALFRQPLPRLPAAGAAALGAAAVALAWPVAAGLPPLAVRAAVELGRGDLLSREAQWRAAAAVREMGLRPGDRIASLGSPFLRYFARRARLQWIAEIPDEDVPRFLDLDPARRRELLAALAGVGARALVAAQPPPGEAAAGWRRAGPYWVLLL